VKICPELGEIRTAQLLPIVVTPYRFKSKRAFWAYCGLGIVMRSSSAWVRAQSGEWVKVPVQQTRGLNRNANRMQRRPGLPLPENIPRNVWVLGLWIVRCHRPAQRAL